MSDNCVIIKKNSLIGNTLQLYFAFRKLKNYKSLRGRETIQIPRKTKYLGSSYKKKKHLKNRHKEAPFKYHKLLSIYKHQAL